MSTNALQPSQVADVPFVARDIPAPSTVSPAAQAVLARLRDEPLSSWPAADDDEGWRALAAEAAGGNPQADETMAMVTTGAVVTGVKTVVEREELGSATYFVAVPEELDEDDDRVLLFIHGGGFYAGGGDVARLSTQLLAGCFGVRTWGIDYRQLPDNPFPAGLDDCIAVYRELLKERRPESIAIGGQSGGANLAAALLLRAKDEGLPMPVAAGLISPPVDLTASGDTYRTNSFTTDLKDNLSKMAERLAGTHDLEHPYFSPLFGTYSPEFPPTILTAGTRDFLLSDTVRLHRKLLKSGVRAELHVWEGAPHGMFMGRAPEDREQVDQVRQFLEQAWEAAAPSAKAK